MTAPLQSAIARQPFTDRMLVAFQGDVLRAFATLLLAPFARGSEVSAGPLASAGTFTVRHLLTRAPRGFLVLDCERAAGATGDLCVYRRASDTRTAERLELYASAGFASITLWVW
jgi:hypothetical protein